VVPTVLFCLDQPQQQPAGTTVTVAGWIAADQPIDGIRIVTPSGRLSGPLPLAERPGIAQLHPQLPHVQGFSTRLGAEWAAEGEIGILYSAGGLERKFTRSLPYAVDMAAKAAKLRRIAPLMRADRPGRLTAHHFDCLTPALRATFDIADTDAVSSHPYDGVALDLIRRHPDGLILDAGAGFRAEYLPNVVNFEIVPYPSTDVLGVGEELPFADNSFDAVFSLSVLEHVKDPFACARELARVLKPGGTLYAAVPFLQPYHGYPHHYYNMTHQGLANLFADKLEVKEQKVLASGHPLWTLWWFLRSYREGLPADLREKFQAMRVADFLGDPQSLLERDFAAQLTEDARFELASATMLLATKPTARPFQS
jgi:SAM-dependent methyltransferase